MIDPTPIGLTPAEFAQDQIGFMVLHFSTVENFLEEYILITYAKHGKKDDKEAFYEDIISHHLFSFEFKRQIFKKALTKNHPNIAKGFPFKELEDLQTLRNIFAHRGLVANSVEELSDLNNIFFAKKKRFFVDVHKEFLYKVKLVEDALWAIPGLSRNEIKSKYYKDGKLNRGTTRGTTK